MSNIIVRKLAVPLGAAPNAHIWFPDLVKTIVVTFYNVLFDDYPTYFLALSHSPGGTSARTFEISCFEATNDEESSTLDILVSTGLTEQHLHNILGILGLNTEGTINPLDKTITIKNTNQVFNYETLALI